MKRISLIHANAIAPGCDQFIGLEPKDKHAAKQIAAFEFISRNGVVFRKTREDDKSVLYESIHPLDITKVPA